MNHGRKTELVALCQRDGVSSDNGGQQGGTGSGQLGCGGVERTRLGLCRFHGISGLTLGLFRGRPLVVVRVIDRSCMTV